MTADQIARHNRAVTLRRADRSPEALHEIEALLASGFDRPETALMHAHLLGDAGRYEEAIARYQTVLAAHPELTDAHETLARLLPQVGRGGEALDSYRDALARMPDIGIIWVSALGTAKSLREGDQLIAWCDQVEQRFGPDTMVTTLRAQALSWRGNDAAALDLLNRTVAIDPNDAPLHSTLAHVALRLGDADVARDAALRAAQIDPNDQTPWALLSVALRLLDDPRELWLADYERHVAIATLEGIDRASVAALLTTLHTTGQHPADQSLRGGTQTRGNLFDKTAPEIISLRRSIEAAVEATLRQLGHDPRHPFLRRNTGRVEFAGSWSVRLRSEGFHVSHIHGSGWLSSACYISLPPEMGQGDAGALAFGVPDAELGLDLPPRRIVHPLEGQLVLFPSYMWHGTLPFGSEAPRLTVAFDALPVDSSAQRR